MHKKVQVLFLSILAVSILVAFMYNFTKPLEIEAMEAKPAYKESYFIEDGTITLSDDYSIYSAVAGKVIEVFVQKDDKIQAGTPIAKVDTKDYETQIQIHQNNIAGYQAQINDTITQESNIKDDYDASLNQLHAKLAQIEADKKISDTRNVVVSLPEESLKILDISIEQSRIELAYFQALYDKNKTLLDAGVIAQAEFDEIDQSLKAAKNKQEQLIKQKESSEHELKKLSEAYGDDASVNTLSDEGRQEQYNALVAETRAQILSTQNNMNKDYKTNMIHYYNSLIKNEESAISLLKDTIDDCTITANEAGTIVDLPVKNMSIVSPQNLLCVIKRDDSNLVESYVATEDVVSLSIGDNVSLIQKTRDRDITYRGVIEDISTWAEEKISALGMIEHRVKVSIRPVEELKTAGGGYGLDVKYIYFKGDDCISAPNSAFFTFQDQDCVFLIVEGKAVITPIKKGSSSSSETIIEQGVNEGDIVVKNASAEGLADGISVIASQRLTELKADES